eukprot:28571-Amphidinium_carterae.1
MDPTEGPLQKKEVEQAMEGAWLSEAAWWCKWRHVGQELCGCTNRTSTPQKHTSSVCVWGTGSASPLATCTMLSVAADSVISAMSRHGTIHLVTLEYAKRFHECLISETHEDYLREERLNVCKVAAHLVRVNPLLIRGQANRHQSAECEMEGLDYCDAD